MNPMGPVTVAHPAGRRGFTMLLVGMPVLALSVIALTRNPMVALGCVIGALWAVWFVAGTASTATVDSTTLSWTTPRGTKTVPLTTLTRLRPARLQGAFLVIETADRHCRIPPVPHLADFLDVIEAARPELGGDIGPLIAVATALDRRRRGKH